MRARASKLGQLVFTDCIEVLVWLCNLITYHTLMLLSIVDMPSIYKSLLLLFVQALVKTFQPLPYNLDFTVHSFQCRLGVYLPFSFHNL